MQQMAETSALCKTTDHCNVITLALTLSLLTANWVQLCLCRYLSNRESRWFSVGTSFLRNRNATSQCDMSLWRHVVTCVLRDLKLVPIVFLKTFSRFPKGESLYFESLPLSLVITHQQSQNVVTFLQFIISCHKTEIKIRCQGFWTATSYSWRGRLERHTG